VRFRAALIASEGDRRLVERTVEMVEKKGGFSSRSLKAALDSRVYPSFAIRKNTQTYIPHDKMYYVIITNSL